LVSQSKINLFSWGLLVFLNFYSPTLFAKSFKNSYIKFNLPEKWDCQLNDKAYICRHKVATSCLNNKENKDCINEIKKSKESIIVMTAKEKSSIDSIESYLNILKQPRKIQKKNGPTIKSNVIHVKTVKINNQTWVDGMHLSSELPFFYTRYLASIKGNVAVLVTFSSHKLFYTQYSNDFFKSIKSLEIITDNTSNIKQAEIGNKVLSRPLDLPDDLLTIDENLKSDSSTSQLLFVGAFLLAILGIYIWIKNNKIK
jgi:hypothetical protein